MAHVIETASSGRAKCRSCVQAIAKGELRFGERQPNAFGEGEMTLWFHPLCAAYKRPESLLDALSAATQELPDSEAWARAARGSLSQRRLQRIDGAELARGQANCRSCHEPIPRGTWRIRLVFFEEGRFNASGFIHVACSKAYFESDEVLERLLHFSPGLSDAQRDELRNALDSIT